MSAFGRPLPSARQHRRVKAVVAAAALVVFSSLVAGALVAGAGYEGGAIKKTDHHHCVHEEKAQRFEESVDPDSLTTPQLIAPMESPHEHLVNAYLDAVGVKKHLRSSSAGRSLAASAASTSFQPIRIEFDVSKLFNDPGYMCTAEHQVVDVDGAAYTCTGGDVLTPDKRDFIVTVLLKAIQDYFQNVLSVQRVQGNLIVKGIGCAAEDDWACCSNSIPQSYKTQGVANADFVLHVTGRPTTGATLAWALPCNLDQYGRPISGQANFGPARIDPTTAAARTEQVGTALHEMTHALVFSRSRFNDFRQPLNGAKWGYNNVVSQSQGAGGIYVSKIVTPSVARQAKQHFNCLDWVNAGVELENGDSGSASFSSHWEKRMMMNEYMTATSSYDPVYSSLTLALFEDSGWYQVSYKNAQILPWGFLEGCGVAQGKCSTWSSRYICSDSTQTGCTADYTSKGYCNVASYTSSIPAGFQYFQDPNFGGRDTYADYCPFVRGYSNGDCRNIGRSATLVDTTNFMEEVGPSSKCFQASLSKSGGNSGLRSACFKVLGCTAQSLKLSIGGKEVLCPMEGGDLTVPGYKGVIVCPVANRLCQMLQDKCSGNGVLLSSGICQCNPGSMGDDCSGISCPSSATNGQECGGSSQGKCDYSTGKCTCVSAYTGLTCSEFVCPASSGGKNTSECSGHGSCDRTYGQCKCQDGFSGKACECVPGCSSTSCGSSGTCDCTTGACACKAGHSGITCSEASDAPTAELTEKTGTITDTIATKAYKFFKIGLSSSTYDITFSVQSSVDVDLYGSFSDKYPTSLSAKSTLFVSDYALGDRDEINLCGSLGVFPRGLNDSFRFCARPTSSFVLETPGFFYVSVLGYAGGQFNLSVVTDKCRNVTCSNHGSCGINYPGVCTCDRYWTGDDCSVPKCGPDCKDLGTCTARSLATSLLEAEEEGDDPGSRPIEYATTTTGSIQTTSECYGNGVCQVMKDAKGRETPRCVCDDAFTFTDPTPTQALCKDLLPSVASVQRFSAPFAVTASARDQVLGVNSWALYTIRVPDAWQILVANLNVLTSETDAMLFIRKEKLPSVIVTRGAQANGTSSAATSASFVQYMDSDGWTSGSSTRKIVLTRATSTLSSGLYYIGVFNSAYARTSLSYTLVVNATSNCSTPADSDSDSGYGVCSNGGSCNAQSSQVCSCLSGFVGRYCGLRATRTVLSAGSPWVINATIATMTTPTTSTEKSYLAYRSPESRLLEIGEWAYFSFDVNDTSVRLALFRLLIDNDLSVATPALPLLLVRGPLDDGFPTLFTENQQDFNAVSRRLPVQSVTVAVDSVCSFAATSKDCYKVGLFNRNYSGEVLRYRLEVELIRSKAAIFPSAVCGSNGDKLNCNDKGKCATIADTTDDTSTPAALTVPMCQCNAGWTGIQCNSPKSFDLSQLWSAITNISLVCSTCSSSFSLARGEVKMFRVPGAVRANSGLLLRVVPAASVVNKSTAAGTSGTNPNVYVSETLPRSMYDFTHISNANGSSSSGQVVRLTNESLTGLFWVVVFSDSPASEVVEVSTTASGAGAGGRRRRLASATSTSYRLEAEVFDLGESDEASLLTDKSFVSVVFHWLFKTPVGIAVFICSLVFVLLVVCFCLWRLCNAPENQDKATRRFFGSTAGGAPSQANYPAGVALGRVGGMAHVSDVEQGARSPRPSRSPRRV